MNWIKTKKKRVILIFLFLITNITTAIVILNLSDKSAEIDNFYRYTQVPDLELRAGMLFYGNIYQGKVMGTNKNGELAHGEITGFVAFNNLSDQPKNTRQYQVITATNRYDDRGYQIFEVDDIIKMSYVSPTKIGEPTELFYLSDNERSLYLTDGNDWIMKIDKISYNAQVSSVDSQGDKSYLITNRSDFEDIMEKMYR
jgi:hypothetical protein